MAFKKSLFFPTKNKRLARRVSIKSPTEFRKSIKDLKKHGLTPKEKQALVLARSRAKVQLKRKNLSVKERKQMHTIAMMKLPNSNSKLKRRR